jgi:uncharacterized protein YdbL (DUF1318 family)
MSDEALPAADTTTVDTSAPAAGAPTEPATSTLATPQPVRSPEAGEMTDHQKFLEMLPEAYRADPLFKNFSNLEDMAKSYSSAAKMVGLDKAQLMRIPSEATPEAMGEVWDKLGRPEAPDKYEGKAFEAIKDYINPDKAASVKELAHKNGISAQAFEALAEWYVKDIQGAVEAGSKTSKETIDGYREAVKKEFGAAYEQKIAMAQRAVKSFGGDELIKVISENEGVFENPAVIKAFTAMGEQMAKIAEQTKEDNGFLPNNSASGHMSPNEAKAAIAELEGDPNFMKIMQDPTHPQRQFMMDKRSKLFAYAYDGAKQ